MRLLTNDNTPTFSGSSAAGATITLVASPTGGGSPITVGHTTMASNGYWRITSAVLPDGSYAVVAHASTPAAPPRPARRRCPAAASAR